MEVDFWDGTLLLLESLDESVVLKLARERRRRSLRKAMFARSSSKVSVKRIHGGCGRKPCCGPSQGQVVENVLRIDRRSTVVF